MTWIRRLPIFVRIAALWWLVLAAYPPSRPFLLYDRPFDSRTAVEAPQPPASTVALRCLLSCLHCLGAGWIVTRALKRLDRRRSLDFLSWTVLIAWFAVASWSALFVLVLIGLAGGTLTALISSGLVALSLLPAFAFIFQVKATWIVIPLAAATVALVRRWVPAEPRLDWLGRRLDERG